MTEYRLWCYEPGTNGSRQLGNVKAPCRESAALVAELRAQRMQKLTETQLIPLPPMKEK